MKDAEKPTPGPGEVLLKVAGAGACHSDVAIFNQVDEGLNPQMDPEFVLGHESTGWVEEVGAGVKRIEPGAAYLSYGPVGCGVCHACTRGQDTYCEDAAKMEYAGIGLGLNGGMAEYVVAPARNLVPLGDADPLAAAPLADAGLTPYHAIKLALPHLTGGGKYALVIGLGGLGSRLIGVQILKALTGATVETAMKSAARQSRVTVVGIGNLSVYEWAFLATAYETELVNTYWGTIEELHEVIDMFKAGQIVPQVTTYSMDEALDASQLLVDGQVAGRAVIVPHGK